MTIAISIQATGSSASRPYAVCSTRTASSVSSSSIRTLTLISLVEMARILMPRSASDLNIPAAMPAWLFMPTPTTDIRSEEHTSELQSLMRISYAVYCLKKTNNRQPEHDHDTTTT